MDDNVVLNALTAIRSSGLCTDRDRLNRAWLGLTGRTPTDPGVEFVPNVAGSCAICGAIITRYGDTGKPLCSTCQLPKGTADDHDQQVRRESLPHDRLLG